MNKKYKIRPVCPECENTDINVPEKYNGHFAICCYCDYGWKPLTGVYEVSDGCIQQEETK